jgi:hypothetical protein
LVSERLKCGDRNLSTRCFSGRGRKIRIALPVIVVDFEAVNLRAGDPPALGGDTIRLGQPNRAIIDLTGVGGLIPKEHRRALPEALARSSDALLGAEVHHPRAFNRAWRKEHGLTFGSSSRA